MTGEEEENRATCFCGGSADGGKRLQDLPTNILKYYALDYYILLFISTLTFIILTLLLSGNSLTHCIMS